MVDSLDFKRARLKRNSTDTARARCYQAMAHVMDRRQCGSDEQFYVVSIYIENSFNLNWLFHVFEPGPWLSINTACLVKYKYSLDLNRKALIISLFAIQSPSIDNWYADSWIHFECELDLQQQLYMIWFWYFIQIIWWKNQTSWTEFKSDIIFGRKINITLQYLVYSIW